MVATVIGVRWAKFGSRINLPADVVKAARNSGLNGKAKLDCWLVVLKPGRYRLAGKEAVSEIIRQIEEIESPAGLLDHTGSDPDDAIPARLIPCTVSVPPPMWRLNFPDEARQLVPEAERYRYVGLEILAGYLELWFPDNLRRAVSVSISDVLS